MTTKTLKFLGVHGLGDHRQSDWMVRWPQAINSVFPVTEGVALDHHFVTYDDIFEKTEISPWESAAALWKLTKSGISSLVQRERGVISEVSDKIRWTASGPYLPLIIEACGEEEFSYEYRHGATSHGAFTYSLAQILRDDTNVTIEQLVKKVSRQLAELKYAQTPQILGPTHIMTAHVPSVGAQVGAES
ncbi:peptidase C14 caspase catalytic subunit p20 [Asticcacaulis biprosthecium C19]|uniref:Peptidase C14 caspase catalytic subunit p20 n=1 Tax=Asticcacaulis biprosthecium C19 TaxID=715226 RepID=F4QPM6_9CAUL|nr:caspase family protein [Asticcacaulis biprosthecium]EGF91284.1 peptidase C14 caspase catalytic subunit p20 [Asticcacaulis biprosthecium C19]